MNAKKRTKREQLLLLTLVDVINQACQYPTWSGKGKCYVDHSCISAYEDAFYELEKYGVIKKTGKKYWIDWRKL